VSQFHQARNGVPHFRQKLENGEPATVVAYGTSMTTDAKYLAAVLPALRAVYPKAAIELKNNGRDGFDSVLAAFDAQSVAAQEPDLVIVEFSINDYVPAILPLIVPALLGVISQVRDARPRCEFVFVYLLRPADAANGALLPMRVHDAFAEFMNFASFNLATLSAEIVNSGKAAYEGETSRVLTRDGVHHSDAVIELLGVPFAQALLDVIGGSGQPELIPAVPSLAEAVAAIIGRSQGAFEGVITPTFAFDGDVFCTLIAEKFGVITMGEENADTLALVLPALVTCVPPSTPGEASPTTFQRARRVPARDYPAAGQWGIGELRHDVRGVDFAKDLLIAVEAGATLRFPVCGSFACFMGFTNGQDLIVRIDGAETVCRPALLLGQHGPGNWPLLIANGLTDARHVIEIVTSRQEIAFADIFYIRPPD
jgi:hypothetical protein